MAAAGRRAPAWQVIALVGMITLIGVALRLPSFSDSLYQDDIGTNFDIHGFGVGSLLHIVESGQEGTPPLFFFLAKLTDGFDGVRGIRVPSMVAGVAAIPLIYLLGLRTVGSPAALVAALLTALSPFQIFYATSARAYALVMLFCVLAALLLLKALDSGRARWWVGYGLSVAAAAYTHYTAFFVLTGLFVWAFIFRPEARRPLLLANLGAALLFAPWFPEFLKDRNDVASLILNTLSPVTLHNLTNYVVRWAIGHPFIPAGELPGHVALALIAAGLLLGTVGLVLRARTEPISAWPPQAEIVLVVILAAAAPAGIVLYSLLKTSILDERNLITSWPGLALAIGALVTAGRPPIRLVAATLLIGGFAIGGVKMLDKNNQRPDLATAAAYIDRNGEPGSPVVEVPTLSGGPQTPFEAALAPKGEAVPRDHRVLPLGYPTWRERLSLARQGVVFPDLRLPPGPTPQQVANRAARIAGNGTVFLATPTPLRPDQRFFTDSFLAALPPRFHEVGSIAVPGFTIPGLATYDITVHVLRGAAATR